MLRYKLTDQNMRTYNSFQWTPGEWVTAAGAGNAPCSNGVLHYYDSPKLAVLLNPAHACIRNPQLWEFETDGELGHDGVKGWCKRGHILRTVPLPAFTTEQQVEFAIRCAMLVYTDARWLSWANNWLSGVDRTYGTADAAYAAARAARAADAAYAARAAAYAAAYAAYAADAADAAYAARAAAYAAARAADAAADAANVRAEIARIAETLTSA